MTDVTSLDDIVQTLVVEADAISRDISIETDTGPVMRDLFLELVVLALANLYGRTPIPASLFDRAMLKVITSGLDDTDRGKLATRTEDWIRLEGLVRLQEGQKSYTLNRPSLAVLSTLTAHGSLGEVMERVSACYTGGTPTPELRRAARQLASYFMTRLGRS